MLKFLCAVVCLFLSACATAPSLEGFDDAVHHWCNKHGENYARYAPSDYRAISDNLLLLLRDHGGWIENRDPARILSKEEEEQALKEKKNPTYSFDNRNIYTQVAYLFSAYEKTRNGRYRQAALRGLELILSSQMKNCGGWAHTTPPFQSYHPKLTIADEIMSGNLTLLRAIATHKPPFQSINKTLRARVALALKAGDECVLRLQIRQKGRLTGWTGQYDPQSLTPSSGRSFELASIVSQETVMVLRYLMTIDKPSQDVIAAVEGGVAWLEAVKIDGQKIVTVTLDKPVIYDFHTARTDRQLVTDPNAPSLWARFYDLEDNRVVLANRDGIRVANYHDIHPERRSGYSWYGTWPHDLLTKDVIEWRKRIKAK